MLEAASELVGSASWEQRQVEINFRVQGAEGWEYRFFASDAANSIPEVAGGRADFAICNPGAVLAMALHGRGPFKESIPVRSIIVLPQFDQIGFAVKADTGLQSLADIRDRKFPLRLSVRGQRDHCVHLMINQVLDLYGFTLDDIRSWGGEIRYDDGMPSLPHRMGAVERGEIDAIWDEAVHNFAHDAFANGMRFLPVDEAVLQKLESIGHRRGPIPRSLYPELEADVWTVDFSGWPVFCLESAPDELVTAFCAAIDARKERVPWYGHGPMDLKLMVSDTPEAPVAVPLHPAAQRYWKERGYLG
jgi:TRAP-type uncharacterized transport system substrate-binding protein